MDFWQSLFPKSNSPDDWQEWLQKYMNESFSNLSPDAMPSMPSSQPSPSSQPNSNSNSAYSMFESFHYVYIHIPVHEISLNDIQVHHTLTQLIIRIHEQPELKITLPAPISKKGATAEVKEETLEICLPKSRQQFEMELSIDPID
ncbi:Hsp20/alpha crystallin family protein [Jeotgalibacillus marinus]|uniref:Hsp20/alpha crystallin family protein n=1 Tax=Jeotgalibacillus marinus TaxID=86667 RepID=A0ABV3Q3T8_9BACL